MEGSADDECCVVVLSGIVTVKSHGETWREIGERNSVFEERSPFAVYLPRSDGITVEVAMARSSNQDELQEMINRGASLVGRQSAGAAAARGTATGKH